MNKEKYAELQNSARGNTLKSLSFSYEKGK